MVVAENMPKMVPELSLVYEAVADVDAMKASTINPTSEGASAKSLENSSKSVTSTDDKRGIGHNAPTAMPIAEHTAALRPPGLRK